MGDDKIQFGQIRRFHPDASQSCWTPIHFDGSRFTVLESREFMKVTGKTSTFLGVERTENFYNFLPGHLIRTETGDMYHLADERLIQISRLILCDEK